MKVVVGSKIGMLEILSVVDTRRVEVRCDCGIIQNSIIKNIESGAVDRCRKCLYQRPETNGSKDLTGQSFGRWVVQHKVKTDRKGSSHYQCLCECGTSQIVSAGHLRRGNTTGCASCRPNPAGKQHAQFKGHEGITANWWYSHVLRSCNGSDKKRVSVELAIDMEHAWNLLVEQDFRCKLTGQPIEISNRKLVINTASLDRIDSSLGYVPGNVQWLHKDINMLKNVYDQDYFIKMCKMVAEHNT